MASVATDKGETDMRKHIRGIVLVLLILLLPCLVWAEDEPENDIEITLNWGFNGKAGNSDACLPVTATLTNHGEAFEGQLEMEVPVAGNQESDLGESLTMIGNDMDYTRSKVCVWKKNIALAAGETRQETFYLTFPWANGTVQAYLKDGSRTVQTASLSKNFSANQDIALIGVIGAQPEDVQQLDGIQISADTTEGMGEAARTSFMKSMSYMGFQPGEPLLGKKVDYVFLGACTNGRIEDFRAFASIVKGRRKAENVVAWLVPGSWMVDAQIREEGLDKILEEAGFAIRQPGCSACLAMNDDKVPAGKYAVSTSNRNFEGRQGPGSRTLLASPLVAAAAAVTGVITDPRTLI